MYVIVSIVKMIDTIFVLKGKVTAIRKFILSYIV